MRPFGGGGGRLTPDIFMLKCHNFFFFLKQSIRVFLAKRKIRNIAWKIIVFLWYEIDVEENSTLMILGSVAHGCFIISFQDGIE